MQTVLEFLIDQLEPDYVGYEDQYRAILYALQVDPDADLRIIRLIIHQMNADPSTSMWEPGLTKRGPSIFETLVQRIRPKYDDYEDQYKEILLVLDIDPDTRASDVFKYFAVMVE